MKNKKKLVAIIMVMALAFTSLIGGTLAYFTDDEQQTNEFTIGNLSIDLYEDTEHTDGLGNVIASETDLGKGTDENPGFKYENVMPGDTMKKIVTVENTCDYDAYIALVIKQENYLNFNRNVDDYYEAHSEYGAAKMQDITDEVFPGWNLLYDKTQVADPDYKVRYTMDTLPAAGEGVTVLGVGYANNSRDADGEYYNYSGDYFTNGRFYESVEGEPDFMTISELANNKHDRVWIVYLNVEAHKAFDIDLTTVCPKFFDNNSVKAFEDMVLDVKAFAIQEKGIEAKDAFAEVLAPGFDF